MNKTSILLGIILSVFLISLTSALTVTYADADTIAPGNQGQLTIDLKNTDNDDVTDVSISLTLTGNNFVAIGGSEDSVDKITEDKTRSFAFILKAANDLKPGNYGIPYTISYTLVNVTKTKTGTVGIIVKANPDLSFTAQTESPVVGQKGKIKLQITNKGLGDAKFVSVHLAPSGFTLLSDSQTYIGSVSSDDFETASYDVIFDKTDSILSALVEYRDFDNKLISTTINIPLTVYTRDEALKLGIITQSYSMYYVLFVILVILVIFITRAIRKRQRLKRSMQLQGGNK
jgi:hypothetical protein